MYKLIMLAFMFIGFRLAGQVIEPDLNKKEDLQKLGKGRIIEKDNCVRKNISLLEIREYWIVYMKDGSTHDMNIQSIKRIEFPESIWGVLQVEFVNNKPEISWRTY